jgi:hypothetical protein
VDPLHRQFPGWSSYSYVFANPISLIDPDGRAPGDPIKAQLAEDGVPITYDEGITITAGTASPAWTATAAANFQNSMAHDPLRPEYKGQRSGIGTIHLTSGGAEIALDVVGTSEIPAVSTVADIGAAGFAFSNGDYWGGGLSLLGAMPAVGAIFNGVKWIKRGRKLVNGVSKEAHLLRTGSNGTTVTVRSKAEADALLKEAFPDYQKSGVLVLKSLQE